MPVNDVVLWLRDEVLSDVKSRVTSREMWCGVCAENYDHIPGSETDACSRCEGWNEADIPGKFVPNSEIVIAWRRKRIVEAMLQQPRGWYEGVSLAAIEVALGLEATDATNSEA